MLLAFILSLLQLLRLLFSRALVASPADYPELIHNRSTRHIFGRHLQIMRPRYHRLHQHNLFIILIHELDKTAINLQAIKRQ